MDEAAAKSSGRTGHSVAPAQFHIYVTHKERDGTQKRLKLNKYCECCSCDFYCDEADELEAH